MLDFSSALNPTHPDHLWLFPESPTEKTNWPIIDSSSLMALEPFEHRKLLKHTTRFCDWHWPERKIHFISDLHADAEALVHSLLLTGNIKKTALKNTDFVITKKCKKDSIIIGGDCLDKGPSNLSLLRTIRKLKQLKKNTILLAGNHDIRLYMGLKSLFHHQNTASEHFFIRMGSKVLPLFKEVYNDYLKDCAEILTLPSEQFCRETLFPSHDWQEKFIQANQERLCSKRLEKELRKIRKKQTNFEADCLSYGLTLPMVYLAAKKCYLLFMEPEGEFYWFFNSMKLVHRENSFLFTHAGIDNKITKVIKKSGIKKVNQLYKKLLNKDLCEFYYGYVANLLRTKYRKTDPRLGKKGVKRMHQLGIHAIVHGHVSQLQGQNISLRSGILHFECDVTLDRNSRLKSGLCGYGAGVTTISPKGKIKGISNDAEKIKIFAPDSMDSFPDITEH